MEDDRATSEFLASGLRRQGYNAESTDSGTDALKKHHLVDLVLLDLELPDIDGLEVCRRIRVACDTPIIAVTDRGTELDRVLGLQAGADDCLAKPYGFRELLARIDAVMRRARPQPARRQLIVCGNLRIDGKTREIRVGDRVVNVTRKEFDLLYLLASQPGTVFSRKQIMSKVWDDDWTKSSRTIDTHVNNLRNKLGDSRWISTVRGVGFRLGRPRRDLTSGYEE